MSSKAIEVTYVGYRFEAQDFVPGTISLDAPVLCDVIAVVVPTDDSIDVEITRVHRERTLENLAGLLRHEAEYKLKPLMRSLYLNQARAGFEGDSHDEEIA